MASPEGNDAARRSHPLGDLESPFVEEALFVRGMAAEWAGQPDLLLAESPFGRAFGPGHSLAADLEGVAAAFAAGDDWLALGESDGDEPEMLYEAAPPLLPNHSTSDPPGQTLYVQIKLGKGSRCVERDEKRNCIKYDHAIPIQPMTGIFIPANYTPQPEVDLILYLHGHKTSIPPSDVPIALYWDGKKYPVFALREAINASRKNVILVAPTLGRRSEPGDLVRRQGLDNYLDKVLAALKTYGPHKGLPSGLTIRNVILAAHSGGGETMQALALSNNRYAASVRECWGFDSQYGSATPWLRWATARPQATFYSYYYNKKPTLNSRRLAKKSPNLYPIPSAIRDHFQLVKHYLAERLRGASFLTTTTAAAPELEAFRPDDLAYDLHLAAEEGVDEAEQPEAYEDEEAMTGRDGPYDEAQVDSFEYDTLTSTTPDPQLAVAPFAPQKRSGLGALLKPADSQAAIRWNSARHPHQSGVAPAHLAAALQSYVDFSAIRQAIAAYNAQRPQAPISAGTQPVDAVFVEAIHQFQLKCYRNPKQHDGLAGSSVLDSLGFWPRRGLLATAATNQWARQRVTDREEKVSLAISQMPSDLARGLRADSWWKSFVNPSFLGWEFNHPIHVYFARRLRQVEQALLSQARFAGKTPAELAGMLDVREKHQGGRTNPSSKSFHTFGLAIDIKYSGNPHIGDYRDKPNGAKHFTTVMKRAAARISAFTLSEEKFPHYLHKLGSNRSRTTGQIFDELLRRDQDLRQYLALEEAAKDLAALRVGVFQGSVARDPRQGFLNLDKDLVIALRDRACLVWGAVDFGPRANGDIMHFDCRLDEIGQALYCGVGGAFNSQHPCWQRAEEPCSEVQKRTGTKKPLPAGELFASWAEDEALDEAVAWGEEPFTEELEAIEESDDFSYDPEVVLESDFAAEAIEEDGETSLDHEDLLYTDEFEDRDDEAEDGTPYAGEDHELDPALVALVEKTIAREVSLVEHEASSRWTRCFSGADIARVEQVYKDNLVAANANPIDRCSCIVMLNVALGQLLSLRTKQHPARSKSARRVTMAALTTEKMRSAMEQLRKRHYTVSPTLMNFYDSRNRTAGTLKPVRLKASVRDKVLSAAKTKGCWFAFGLSVMNDYHSVLLLVDRTGAAAKIYWLDQFSSGLTDDVTDSLDQRLTDYSQRTWQAIMDDKKKGYDTLIRLWPLRKPKGA